MKDLALEVHVFVIASGSVTDAMWKTHIAPPNGPAFKRLANPKLGAKSDSWRLVYDSADPGKMPRIARTVVLFENVVVDFNCGGLGTRSGKVCSRWKSTDAWTRSIYNAMAPELVSDSWRRGARARVGPSRQMFDVADLAA